MERSAVMAQNERCKRQRLRRHFANSAGGMDGADHGARADSAPRCARRREAALQGDGRLADQAMQGAFADGWRIAEKAESAVAEWQAVQSRQRARANRAPHRPRKPSNLRGKRRSVKRTHPKAIFRLSSGAVRKRQRCFPHRAHGWGEAVRTMTGSTRQRHSIRCGGKAKALKRWFKTQAKQQERKQR